MAELEVVEPPDGETAAIAFLDPLLASAPEFFGVEVLGSLPAETPGYVPPGEAVVVRGTGGVRLNPAVWEVQLTLTCWAAAPLLEVRASNIAARAVALLDAAERLGYLGGVPCSAVLPLAVPYNDPDPTTGRARYSATVRVHLRGRPVRVTL